MDMEFLEFKLDGQSFGIGIDLVEEISSAQPITEVPNSHPSVEGVYSRRSGTTTVINLRNCLGKDPKYSGGEFIVSAINGAEAAFHIDSVVGIHKVGEDKLLKPSVTEENGLTKWLVKIEDKIITVLDFNTIIREITGLNGKA